MQAKTAEREAARKLRSEGKTTHQIVEALKVSQGSVWNWIKDIKLSAEHTDAIHARMSARAELGRKAASLVNRKGKALRLDKARTEADTEWLERKQNFDFLLGLALYIGEGTKSGVALCVTNTDVRVLRKVVTFLLTLGVERTRLNVYVHLHEGNDKDAAEAYWLKELELDRSQLGKTSWKKNRGTSSKYPYGIGHVSTHDSHLRRKIDRWSELALTS